MGIFNFSFLDGEKPLLVLRTHWTSYFNVCVGSVLLLVAFVGLLTKIWPTWWENKWGVLGLVFVMVVDFLSLAVNLWKKFLTTYIVTNSRVIDITQEKILQRAITEISLSEIEEAKVKPQSWWEKINGRGNIILKLQDRKGTIIFYNIKDPEKTLETLKETKEAINKILRQEGEECNVLEQGEEEQKVPLTYSYFGEKGKTVENDDNDDSEGEEMKENGELKIVKKNKIKKKNAKKKNS